MAPRSQSQPQVDGAKSSCCTRSRFFMGRMRRSRREVCYRHLLPEKPQHQSCQLPGEGISPSLSRRNCPCCTPASFALYICWGSPRPDLSKQMLNLRVHTKREWNAFAFRFFRLLLIEPVMRAFCLRSAGTPAFCTEHRSSPHEALPNHYSVCCAGKLLPTTPLPAKHHPVQGNCFKTHMMNPWTLTDASPLQPQIRKGVTNSRNNS